jgi:outer membrane protein OmpA-like peptidoglycan-associated protein
VKLYAMMSIKQQQNRLILVIAATVMLTACATKPLPKPSPLESIMKTGMSTKDGAFCTMGTKTDLGGIAKTPDVYQHAIGKCKHPDWRNEELIVLYLGDDGVTTPALATAEELDNLMHPEDYLGENEINDLDCAEGSECQSVTASLKKGVSVHFESDSSSLGNQAEIDLVKRIARIAQGKKIVIAVTGHTDSSSTQSHNAPLSIRRAETIKKLLSANGLDSRWVTTDGRASSRPVSTNKTLIGRAENRRAELISKDATEVQDGNAN